MNFEEENQEVNMESTFAIVFTIFVIGVLGLMLYNFAWNRGFRAGEKSNAERMKATMARSFE